MTTVPAPIEPEIILSVRNVSIEYRLRQGALTAVRNVSFDLKKGEILAIIGESGSGKTTLGLGLIRLLPNTAKIKNGQIIFYRRRPPENNIEEIPITSLDYNLLRKFRWQDCAMVFQSALNSLNPVMRVSDHFKDTLQAHGKKFDAESKENIFNLLDLVRLDADRAWNSYPHELSGGMKQRIIIALALLLKPKILILDEPTTALDILTQRSVINLLIELRNRLNFSMIYISHDLSLAAELADRVITMYAGRTVEEASVYTTFLNPQHPYTIGLINAVPTLSTDNEDLISIPGSPPDLLNLPSGCDFHPRCPMADQLCQQDEPLLETLPEGHRVACWKWSKIANRKDLFITS